jgi:hypothetical protein
MGVNEEKALRDEIERTLAISEYVQGMPKSSDEPLGKVAMLIGQSNLRLSSFAQNLSETLTRLANMLIELNQEFIEEDKLYRVVGDEVSFKEFTMADKEVKVDAVVTVDPVVPPDQQARLNQSLLLYDKFVAQDKPDPNNPDEVNQWKKKKRVIQEMILEEMGKEAYRVVILGEEKNETTQSKEPVVQPEEPPPISEAGAMPEALPPAAPQARPGFLRSVLSKIPFISRGQNINQ